MSTAPKTASNTSTSNSEFLLTIMKDLSQSMTLPCSACQEVLQNGQDSDKLNLCKKLEVSINYMELTSTLSLTMIDGCVARITLEEVSLDACHRRRLSLAPAQTTRTYPKSLRDSSKLTQVTPLLKLTNDKQSG